MTKKKVYTQSDWMTQRRVALKSTTKKFDVEEREDADEYASQKNSYVCTAIDPSGEFVGYYVPA